jgi:hypothetical protein
VGLGLTAEQPLYEGAEQPARGALTVMRGRVIMPNLESLRAAISVPSNPSWPGPSRSLGPPDRVAPLELSGFPVDDRGLGTGVGGLPAGEIDADLTPLLLLVRCVRHINLELVRSPLFGNATGSAQEILQAEKLLRILEKDVHATMRSPEWPQRGRFSQFHERGCDVKPFTAAEALENSEDPQTHRPVGQKKSP